MAVPVLVAVGVGVLVGVSVEVGVGVGDGVAGMYVYPTQTVAPAFVDTTVRRFPAPLAEKSAAALTGIVMVPEPMKSDSGKYGERAAVSEAVTPVCVTPDVPPKSADPSNAVKL